MWRPFREVDEIRGVRLGHGCPTENAVDQVYDRGKLGVLLLPGGAGQGRQSHILFQEDDISSRPDLLLEAGYLHKVRGLGHPVRVREGVAS